jgi:hypothetical protein
MLFSVSNALGLEIKKPPSLAVSGILCRTAFCFRVNLPLLHRRLAGIAKVKAAGKPDCVVHGGSEWVGPTITTIPETWQLFYPPDKSSGPGKQL